MEKRKRFIINIIFTALLIGLFYLGLGYILPLVLPFAIAFAVAWALQRPIRLLQERFGGIPGKAISAAVITIFLATVGTAAVLLIGALIRQIVGFASDIPAMAQELLARLTDTSGQAETWLQSLPQWLSQPLAALLRRLRDDMPGFIMSAVDSLSGPLLSSASAIGAFAMRLPSALISVFIGVIAVYFIGMDFSGVTSDILRLCPASMRDQFIQARRYSASTILQLLRTYAFLMLLTFTELAVGFAIMNLLGAGLSYIVPLALLISLVDILPVLGVGTVLLPWSAVDLITGMTARAIMLLVLYVLIVIVRNFLEPKLVGERFGLHPAATLLAIYVGGRLFGFIGVFLLPLTLIIIRRLYDAGALSQGGDMRHSSF